VWRACQRRWLQWLLESDCHFPADSAQRELFSGPRLRVAKAAGPLLAAIEIGLPLSVLTASRFIRFTRALSPFAGQSLVPSEALPFGGRPVEKEVRTLDLSKKTKRWRPRQPFAHDPPPSWDRKTPLRRPCVMVYCRRHRLYLTNASSFPLSSNLCAGRCPPQHCHRGLCRPNDDTTTSVTAFENADLIDPQVRLSPPPSIQSLGL